MSFLKRVARSYASSNNLDLYNEEDAKKIADWLQASFGVNQERAKFALTD